MFTLSELSLIQETRDLIHDKYVITELDLSTGIISLPHYDKKFILSSLTSKDKRWPFNKPLPRDLGFLWLVSNSRVLAHQILSAISFKEDNELYPLTVSSDLVKSFVYYNYYYTIPPYTDFIVYGTKDAEIRQVLCYTITNNRVFINAIVNHLDFYETNTVQLIKHFEDKVVEYMKEQGIKELSVRSFYYRDFNFDIKETAFAKLNYACQFLPHQDQFINTSYIFDKKNKEGKLCQEWVFTPSFIDKKYGPEQEQFVKIPNNGIFKFYKVITIDGGKQ